MCTDTNNKELIQADCLVKNVSETLNKMYVQAENADHTKDSLLLECCVDQLNSAIFWINRHRTITNTPANIGD